MHAVARYWVFIQRGPGHNLHQYGGSAGILALDTNFYEFIPEAEIDNPSPVTLGVGQMEAGESYYIGITSPAGLNRYDINDVVRVAGFFTILPWWSSFAMAGTW